MVMVRKTRYDLWNSYIISLLLLLHPVGGVSSGLTFPIKTKEPVLYSIPCKQASHQCVNSVFEKSERKKMIVVVSHAMLSPSFQGSRQSPYAKMFRLVKTKE
jgi:hypothetical protein